MRELRAPQSRPFTADAPARGSLRTDVTGLWRSRAWLEQRGEPICCGISAESGPCDTTKPVPDPDEHALANEWGDQLGPWALQRAIRSARAKVPGLPPDFRFHDLRHHLASMLIASGADVKVAQARLRHASAKTTLDTYAHLWPDSEESTRASHRRGDGGAPFGREETKTSGSSDDGTNDAGRIRADDPLQGNQDFVLTLRRALDRHTVSAVHSFGCSAASRCNSVSESTNSIPRSAIHSLGKSGVLSANSTSAFAESAAARTCRSFSSIATSATVVSSRFRVSTRACGRAG